MGQRARGIPFIFLLSLEHGVSGVATTEADKSIFRRSLSDVRDRGKRDAARSYLLCTKKQTAFPCHGSERARHTTQLFAISLARRCRRTVSIGVSQMYWWAVTGIIIELYRYYYSFENESCDPWGPQPAGAGATPHAYLSAGLSGYPESKTPLPPCQSNCTVRRQLATAAVVVVVYYYCDNAAPVENALPNSVPTAPTASTARSPQAAATWVKPACSAMG